MIGLDTVAVVVSDRKASIAWYRDILGLRDAYIGPTVANSDPAIRGPPELPGHWIEMGAQRPTTRIHLCELADKRTEPGHTVITFLSDNILDDYHRMKKQDVRFLSSPRKMDRGEWLCQFADGNVFELKQ